MYVLKRKIKSLQLISFCLFLGMMVTITSCDTSNNTEKEQTQETDNLRIATVSNGEIVQKASDAELRRIATETYNDMPSSDDKKVGDSFWKEIYIEGKGNHYYIIGEGKKANGNGVSVANPLVISDQKGSNKKSLLAKK